VNLSTLDKDIALYLPYANILLIVTSLLTIYLYFKSRTIIKKVAEVDSAGKPTGKLQDVPVLRRELPQIKFLRGISSLLGIACILTGIISAVYGTSSPWDAVTNLVFIFTGLAATANSLFRFPWASVLTGILVIGMWFASDLLNQPALMVLRQPYALIPSAAFVFSLTYLKLKWLEDILNAASESARKLMLLFGFIGLMEGLLTFVT
jgi:hypothetical protein